MIENIDKIVQAWDQVGVEKIPNAQYWYSLWGAAVISDRPLDLEDKLLKSNLIEAAAKIEQYDILCTLFYLFGNKIRAYTDKEWAIELEEKIGKNYYETEW